MAKVRVPRTGVTAQELATVLRRRLGDDFEVADDQGEVLARRSPLSAVVVRIAAAPGATVFRVHGVGVPVVSALNAHTVAEVLRRSPEFRSI